MSDIKLPDMSGLSVAKKSKDISQKASIILLGWGSGVPNPEEIKNSGVDLIMSRPFLWTKVASRGK